MIECREPAALPFEKVKLTMTRSDCKAAIACLESGKMPVLRARAEGREETGWALNWKNKGKVLADLRAALGAQIRREDWPGP